MSNLNIPIYRAKKIDSDEYVEGYYYPAILHDKENGSVNYASINNKYCISNMNDDYKIIEKIDPSTLAIHFPDMLDSEGNKIFASLSEDGKGGDILIYNADSGRCLSCGAKIEKTKVVAIYEKMQFKEIALNEHECFSKRECNYTLEGNLRYKKIIGIQK